MKVIYLFIASPIEFSLCGAWKLEYKAHKRTINSLYYREIETDDITSMNSLQEEINEIKKSHPYSTVNVIIL